MSRVPIGAKTTEAAIQRPWTHESDVGAVIEIKGYDADVSGIPRLA